MRKLSIFSLLTLCALTLWGKAPENQSPEITVMTFNIRNATSADKENGWEYRADRVTNAVKFYKADLIGMQEVRPVQLEDMKERLPELGYVGVSRTGDDSPRGEHCTILYRKSRFDVIDSGTFWLSETPDVPGSKGWDTSYPRIATWAKLKDKESGKMMLMINTHLDHRGPNARREGAALLLKKASEIASGLPIVMTGDFNATPESEPYSVITDKTNPLHMTDSRTISPLVYGPAWTWHNFGRLPIEKRCFLDYLFVKNGVKVNRYGVLAEMDGKEFLSDHAPALIGITL